MPAAYLDEIPRLRYTRPPKFEVWNPSEMRQRRSTVLQVAPGRGSSSSLVLLSMYRLYANHGRYCFFVMRFVRVMGLLLNVFFFLSKSSIVPQYFSGNSLLFILISVCQKMQGVQSETSGSWISHFLVTNKIISRICMKCLQFLARIALLSSRFLACTV